MVLDELYGGLVDLLWVLETNNVDSTGGLANVHPKTTVLGGLSPVQVLQRVVSATHALIISVGD